VEEAVQECGRHRERLQECTWVLSPKRRKLLAPFNERHHVADDEMVEPKSPVLAGTSDKFAVNHDFGAEGDEIGGELVRRREGAPLELAFNFPLVLHLPLPQEVRWVSDHPGRPSSREANTSKSRS
jgi:hypothetical protein